MKDLIKKLREDIDNCGLDMGAGWDNSNSVNEAQASLGKLEIAIEKKSLLDVSDLLPAKSKFIDLLIENTEHAGRDEGVYFSDTLRYDCTDKDVRDFQRMIEDYKKQ